ncbi:FAD-dependent oxidoreductase [Flexivirga oryzae]|uniref:Assimilatory nitrate reductase electron transfer subunit n=1 Tax=Flexivirga oryzae TaxID=1794944 RepID=A0A839NCT5_9MICO|nr:assimilatory nitrate reductase electron transfer subunit [Flexivirga oryzae]
MTTPTRRIVLVGHGMVAVRLLDQLGRVTTERPTPLDVTVVGDEPHDPYNRLLLSEVLAGRAELGRLTLPEPTGSPGMTVRVLRGVAATVLDRDRRVVHCDDGSEHPYDTVVLATGSAAREPLPGCADEGVRMLRTIDDCRELLAACSYPRRAVVVGGGLLGLEIACGLAGRGAAVQVLHRGTHVLDRQLPPAAGAVAGAALAHAGVEVLTEADLESVRRDDDRLVGVRLRDGRELPADLVVASAGVVPRTEIAARAGLPVRTGIVVDDDLRSPADPRVAAIGDCAETPDGCPGLLAPGWAQADRLARDLAGLPPVPTAPAPNAVVKLKAVGVDVVTIGDGPEPPAGAHTVTLSDPMGRRHVQVSVADDRVVAACCVGAKRVAADLTAAYERGGPVPPDPALLLLDGLPTATVSATDDPTTMPSATTVCRCNGVTKKDIVDAHVAGDRDLSAVAARTRATTGCGGCTEVVCGLLAWMDDVNPPNDVEPSNDVAHRKHSRNDPGNFGAVTSCTTQKEISR